MSYHAIENLVQDTIEKVLKSPLNKKDKYILINDLYLFQSGFDTSNTVLRLKDYLISAGYLVFIERDEVERVLKKKIGKNDVTDQYGWINNKDYSFIYSIAKDGAANFYYEYFSKYAIDFKKNKFKKKTISDFFLSIFDFLKKDTDLIHEWHWALITLIVNGDLNAKNLFNITNYKDIDKNNSILILRQIFLSNTINKDTRKTKNFKRISTKKINSLLKNSINELILVLFLVNTDQLFNDILIDQEKILKKYQKQIDKETENKKIFPPDEALIKISNMTLWVEDILKTNLNLSLVKTSNKHEDTYSNIVGSWLFEFPKKNNNSNYLYLELRHDSFTKGIMTYLLTKSDLLESWQNDKNTDLNPKKMHFCTYPIEALRAFEIKSNLNISKDWKMTIDSSKNQVQKVFLNIAECIQKISEQYQNFYNDSVGKILEDFEINTFLLNKKNRLDLIHKYGFFRTDIELIYAFASLKWKKTNNPPEQEINLLIDLSKKPNLNAHESSLLEEGIIILNKRPFFPSIKK